jgi:hypothetical protein
VLFAFTALSISPRPAFAENAKLFVVSPLPIVLGEVEQISLVIEAPETPETEGRPLQVSVNVGRLDPPERVGRGKYRAHYHLPTTKFPQSAIVAVWRETGPDAQVDFLRIPLSARTKLPVKSKPGAEVRVFVAEDRFGPVSADRKGQALVPIVVPPGVREVDVDTIAGLDKKRSRVPVKVPPYNRLALAVSPYLVPPLGSASAIDMPYATVHVYYDDERAPPPEKLAVRASAGEVRFVGVKGSRYTYRVTPPRSAAEKEIKIVAYVDGDSPSTSQATILLGTPIAERILSRTSSTSIAANGASTKVVRVLVVDHYGLGVSGANLTATANAGTVGEVRELGAGFYEAVLTAPSSMPKKRKATVTVALAGGGGAPISLDVDAPLISGGTGGGAAEVPDAVAETPGATTPRKTHTLTIGARLGGTYDAQFAPLGGLEIAIRPNILDRRLNIFAAVAFRSMAREFGIDGFPGLKSSITRVPITAGLAYDFISRENGRGYIGVAGGVAGVAHRVEASFQDPIVYRRMVPTAEAILGASYAGVFLEAAGIFMQISDEALTMPSIGVSASLGYRLGLF